MSILRSTLPFVTALMILLPSMTLAQDVVGTTVIGGKRVDLLSDGTWKYTTTNKPSGCVSVHNAVDFCGSTLEWRKTKSASTNFSAMFQFDDRHYAGLIVENVGRADGYSNEFLRSVALQGAADGAGVSVEQIPVHDVMEATVDNKKAETIVYSARIEGVDFIFANTIFIGEKLTVQAIVWSVGTEFSETHQQINQSFIKALKISTEEPEN